MIEPSIWRGARVECTPRKPLPSPETVTVSERHRLDLCHGYARLLSADLKRELAGRLMREAMEDEHAEQEIVGGEGVS